MHDLTIVLTLKDRKEFTRRWLDWMVDQSCEFYILIADGDADKSSTKALLKQMGDNQSYNEMLEACVKERNKIRKDN